MYSERILYSLLRENSEQIKEIFIAFESLRSFFWRDSTGRGRQRSVPDHQKRPGGAQTARQRPPSIFLPFEKRLTVFILVPKAFLRASALSRGIGSALCRAFSPIRYKLAAPPLCSLRAYPVG